MAVAPALAAAGMLVGCSSTRPPSFAIVDAQLGERSDKGFVVHFTVEGTNDNAKPLPLHDISYTLRLNGTDFQAHRFAGCTLPRYGTASIDLPVSFDAADASAPNPAGSHDYRFSGTITYEPPGAFSEVLFDAHIRRPDVSFSEDGVLNFEP